MTTKPNECAMLSAEEIEARRRVISGHQDRMVRQEYVLAIIDSHIAAQWHLAKLSADKMRAEEVIGFVARMTRDISRGSLERISLIGEAAHAHIVAAQQQVDTDATELHKACGLDAAAVERVKAEVAWLYAVVQQQAEQPSSNACQFACAVCQVVGVGVDEDDCCRTCGADAIPVDDAGRVCFGEQQAEPKVCAGCGLKHGDESSVRLRLDNVVRCNDCNAKKIAERPASIEDVARPSAREGQDTAPTPEQPKAPECSTAGTNPAATSSSERYCSYCGGRVYGDACSSHPDHPVDEPQSVRESAKRMGITPKLHDTEMPHGPYPEEGGMDFREPQSAEVLTPDSVEHIRGDLRDCAHRMGHGRIDAICDSHEALRRKCAELEEQAVSNFEIGLRLTKKLEKARAEADELRAKVSELMEANQERQLFKAQAEELRARCAAIEQALLNVLYAGACLNTGAWSKAANAANALLTTPATDAKAEKEGK